MNELTRDANDARLYHDISYFTIEHVGMALCGADVLRYTPQPVKYVRDNGYQRCPACGIKRREQRQQAKQTGA